MGIKINTEPRLSVQTLLDRVVGWELDATGALAVCPTHDDGHPSLKIDVAQDGKLLLFCRAGCKFKDIAQALDVDARVKWFWPEELHGSALSAGRVESVDDETLSELDEFCGAASALFAGSDAAWYAAERFGLSERRGRSIGLGFSPEGGIAEWDATRRSFNEVPRLFVPFLGFDGIPRGGQARALVDHDIKWCGLANVDGKAWSRYAVMEVDNGLDYVVITEGPSDGLTAFAAGYTSVTIRGAALSRDHELARELSSFLAGKIVMVAGDADSAGADFNENITALLCGNGVDARVLKVRDGCNDLNEWYRRDPAAFANELATACRASNRLLRSVAPVDSGSNNVWSEFPHDEIPLDGLTNAVAAKAIAWYVEKTGRQLRFVGGLGLTVFENGQYWPNNKQRVRALLHEAADAARGFDAVGNMTDTVQMLGQRLGQTYYINSTLTEIEALVREMGSDVLDSNEELLLCGNGVVNLRTGKLMTPTADMHLSARLDFNYYPDAVAPRWERFLREIMQDDQDMVDFLQRLVGYGITGSTVEQCFTVLQGTGANGKSIFVDALSYVFGPIAKTVPFAVFESASFGGGASGPSPEIARLRGNRLTLTGEGEEGVPIKESLIKSLTGGDTITARHLYGTEFEFKPRHLIMMATNHLPMFKGVDEGLWRRVKIIKFNRYFAPGDREKRLHTVLESEAEGILAWAIRGAMAWYEAEGLNEPAPVVEATQHLRETSDVMAGFFPDGHMVLTGDENDKVLLRKAYVAFEVWADEEGANPYTIRWFRRQMESRGAVVKKLKSGITLCGVSLLTPAQRKIIADAQ